MQLNWNDLINTVVWATVALLALFLLRHPLGELVSQIARRARKLSVYNVSVELATLPMLSAPRLEEIRELSYSNISDSGSQTLVALVKELLKPRKADYAVVDLGTGHEWLTSRLYLFALLLGTITGVRAFVFIETAGGIRRKFLGVGTPTAVQRALSTRYKWLQEAYLRAAASTVPSPTIPPAPGVPDISKFTMMPPMFGDADEASIEMFVRDFIGIMQRTTSPPPDEIDSYIQLKPRAPEQTWERAHWIDGERLERDMAGLLSYDWCEVSPDMPRSTIAEAIARRSGEFVALVDHDRHFIALVDRYALLEQLWKDKEADKTNSRESTAS